MQNLPINEIVIKDCTEEIATTEEIAERWGSDKGGIQLDASLCFWMLKKYKAVEDKIKLTRGEQNLIWCCKDVVGNNEINKIGTLVSDYWIKEHLKNIDILKHKCNATD